MTTLTNEPVLREAAHRATAIAEQNRQKLTDNGVFTVSIFGGPGSGKTSLLDATLARLMPQTRAGVIACDVFSHRDADRIALRSSQVVQVNTGDGESGDTVKPSHVRDALLQLNLGQLDVLFIENVGSLTGHAAPDLGQEASVVLLSVAGGDDKADKHPNLIRAADVVLLNKIDLLRAMPFDLDALRADVRRINPKATFIELSSLHGHGIDRWIEWLNRGIDAFRSKPKAALRQHGVSNWFG
jgi:hydrogenase nickel incorporation protein HypB